MNEKPPPEEDEWDRAERQARWGNSGKYQDYGADPQSEWQRETVVPVDLWDAFAPPELPKGVLPPVIEDYALIQGKLIGSDPAGIAMACLAVAASAITDEIEVQVLVNNPQWREPARMWVGIVGDVSDKKTPIIKAAIWPLDDIDAELFAVYEKEMAEYEALPKEKKAKEKKPVMTHLVVNNLTIESAEEALLSNPHGILVHNDELAEWFSSMERYYGSKAASDRPFWLQTYNGGRRRVGRIIRGHKMIRNCSVCLIGGIQPDKIREIASMFADDGLLQRLLMVILRPGQLALDAPQGNETTRYKRLIERLYGMRKQSADMVVNKKLKFDATAQQVMYRVQKANDELSQLKIVNRKLASAIGKGDGVFARLCVVFHCIEHAHEHMLPFEISGDTAARVERFVKEFVQPHQLAFFVGTLGLSDDHDSLTQIAGLILAHKLTQVTNRIVQRIGGKVKLDNWTIQKLFEQLYALGWLLSVEKLRSNDPGTWTVNPAVHELFADRAAAEIARREAGREAVMRLRNRKEHTQ